MTANEKVLSASEVNAALQSQVGQNWLHKFDLTDDGQILSPESFSYRRRMYDAVFSTLLRRRSVLVLNEASGVYPALVYRAGAKEVAASTEDDGTAALIEDVLAFTAVPGGVLRSQMLTLVNGTVHVDQRYGAGFDALLAIGQIWPLFRVWESFDAIVEACSYFVTEAVVFDWTDAEWASPPPPPEYRVERFVEALERKFEFVIRYSDWLVVAVSKRPAAVETPGGYGPAFAERFRAVIERSTAAGAPVLVVSKGDPELVALGGREGRHFPQDTDGQYVGHHPADSSTAIAELEHLRGRGAQYFVIPQPSFWWLEHYRELREHLEREYRLVTIGDHCCVIFDVR